MLFDTFTSPSFGLALTLGPLVDFMSLDASRRLVAPWFVGMHVGRAIDPRARPWPLVDDHGVRVPAEAVAASPAPRPESRGNRDPAKPDGPCDSEAGPRRSVDHDW